MRRSTVGVLAAMLVAALPAAGQAQESGLAAACAAVPGPASLSCRVAAQAAESAQPQLGILVAGGNPTLGAVSAGGLRLGVLPRLSASVQANLVQARIPDLRSARIAPTDGIEYGEVSIVAPALSASAALELFRGVALAPALGGIGSVDLLGTAAWLPVRALGSDDFRPSTADLAWGAGVRVGLLRESFTAPGASLSVVYHRLGTVAYGEVCPAAVTTGTRSGPGYTLEEGRCVPTDLGDVGEFSFDLGGWSTRAVVGKHLLGLGLAAGVGYDRYSSDLALGLRTPAGAFSPPDYYFARVRDAELKQGRWSGFVNGSLPLLVARLSVEAGWMQGGDAVAGYPAESSDFDPGEGTLFGSVGLRVAF